MEKVHWLGRIGPKLFLQTRSKPASPHPRWGEAHAHLGRDPKWKKYAGLLESDQTFSADSLQSCQSFASVRSRSLSVRNFAHPRSGEVHWQAGREPKWKKYAGLLESAQTFRQTRTKVASHLRALYREFHPP